MVVIAVLTVCIGFACVDFLPCGFDFDCICFGFLLDVV